MKNNNGNNLPTEQSPAPSLRLLEGSSGLTADDYIKYKLIKASAVQDYGRPSHQQFLETVDLKKIDIQANLQKDKFTLKPTEFILEGALNLTNRERHTLEVDLVRKMKVKQVPIKGRYKPQTKKPAQNSNNSDMSLLISTTSLDLFQPNCQAKSRMSPPQTGQIFEVQTLLNAKEAIPKQGAESQNGTRLQSINQIQLHHNQGHPFSFTEHSSDNIGYQESSEGEKIGSRHYQDYLHSNEHSEQESATAKLGQVRVTKSVNLQNTASKFNSTMKSLNHDFTIEEIKENHFSKIQKAIYPYMKQKLSVLLDGDVQMKNRILKHSYESYKRQMRLISPVKVKQQLSVDTSIFNRTIFNNKHPTDFNHMHPTDPKRQTLAEQAFQKYLEANQVGRIIAPKVQVKVPNEFIMMKIAQHQIDLHKKEFTIERNKSIIMPNDFTVSQSINVQSDLRHQSLPPIQSRSLYPTIYQTPQHLSSWVIN